MNKFLAIAVIAAALSGCANQRFNLSGDVSETATATTETSQPFFVSGIGQKKTIDAASICGGASKVKGVAVDESPVNVLLSMVTFGIYTPRTAYVYCN